MGTFTKPASEFKEMPAVQEHIHLAADMLARYRAADFIDEMNYRLAAGDAGFAEGALEFDSPLEVLFWIWWSAAMRWQVLFREKAALWRHVAIEAQGRHYNIDFVVVSTKGDTLWPKIGIELDGHAFHEKTLEQVTYRNQRDRALQQAGWHIFHVSWDEFTTNAERVIWEIVEFMQTAYGELKRAQSAALTKQADPVGDDAL